MAARERTREYAVLKTLGFQGRHIVAFIVGESLLIALCGGLLGLALTFPIVRGFGLALPGFFPVIHVEPVTIALALSAALLAGLAASIVPTVRALRTPIVSGLRMIG
jgi:putative ABC transport system permease protein